VENEKDKKRSKKKRSKENKKGSKKTREPPHLEALLHLRHPARPSRGGHVTPARPISLSRALAIDVLARGGGEIAILAPCQSG
jgi:hypothetical protein